MELKAPQFWHYMLRHLFRVERQRLREELWRNYPKSTALVWHLMQCGRPAASPQVAYERGKVICELLSPATLLRVAEGLVPVGKPRPRELRQFEETVLYLTDAHGKFKWMPEEHTNGHKRATPHRQT